MKRFVLPCLAAVLGLAALLALAPRYHPAASLGYSLDRDEMISRARQIAFQMGLDASQWRPTVSTEVAYRLTYYLHTHPEDPAAPLLSAATAKVALSEPGSDRITVVTLGARGNFLDWDRKQQSKGPARMTIESRFLAERAMRMLTGSTASKFQLVTDGAEGADGVRFGWEMPPGIAGQITVQCKVLIRDGVLVAASLSPELNNAWRSEYDSRFGKINFAAATFGFILTLGVAGALAFYLWCSLRRPLRHSFVLSFAIAGLLLACAGYLLGGSWPSALAGLESEQRNIRGDLIPVVGLTMLGFLALFVGTAGAGLGAIGPAAARWRSAIDLFGRRIPARSAGEAFLAGLLTSPLIAAAPVIIAASGLMAEPRLVIYDSEGILSVSPLLSVFAESPTGPALVLLFGFLLPTISRIRLRYLRIALCILFGWIYCVGMLGSKLHPTLLSFSAGAMVFALLWYLYEKFDIMAMLGAGIGSAFCQQAAMLLLQPAMGIRSEAWPIMECGAGLLLGSAVLAWKGRASEAIETAPQEPLDESTERDRLMADFSIAHRAQQEMLPSSPPFLPGYSLAASCTPAREVGGDLFDFLQLSDGRLGISVADVSGKGVPAALYMTLTKGLLTATTQDSTDLPRILDQVNVHLHAAGKRKIFVTMAMGFLDLSSRVIEYARAGHNPVVWRRVDVDETRLLASGGMGLGITGGKAFARALRVDRLQLNTGDALVFYSDGLTEAMNAELEQYGEERLMAAVAESDGHDARRTHDHILRNVREFLAGEHPQDDLTLVVLRVEAQTRFVDELAATQ